MLTAVEISCRMQMRMRSYGMESVIVGKETQEKQIYSFSQQNVVALDF
jgi:hypothetical protein